MDIRTTWDSEALFGSWSIENGAMASDGDLETAVILSLFTDRLATADDRLPDGGADRRGWWGDQDGRELHGLERVGSRLWLLAREKQTEDTRNRAEAYAREALEWLLEDGVAARIDIASEWQRDGRLAMAVTIYRKDGNTFSCRFDRVWDQVEV